MERAKYDRVIPVSRNELCVLVIILSLIMIVAPRRRVFFIGHMEAPRDHEPLNCFCFSSLSRRFEPSDTDITSIFYRRNE